MHGTFACLAPHPWPSKRAAAASVLFQSSERAADNRHINRKPASSSTVTMVAMREEVMAVREELGSVYPIRGDPGRR